MTALSHIDGRSGSTNQSPLPCGRVTVTIKAMTRGRVGRGSTRWSGHRRLAAARRILAAIVVAASASVSPALRSSAAATPEPLAPTVHCGWVMPNTGDSTTFTYGPDDDATTERSAGTPCFPGAEGGAFQPTGASGLAHIIVDPLGTGIGREIELWAVVSHPSSDAFATESGTVSWTVYAPNGSVVSQVFPTGRSCAGTVAPGPMWAAASNGPDGLGVFAANTVENLEGTGLWQSCRQGRLRMFFGRLTLASGSPCGSYSVATTATVEGKSTELRYGFDVICPTRATLDAVDVLWNVFPGGAAHVVGDLDPTTAGAPTVTNNGPNPIQVGLVFTPLVRAGSPEAPAIAEFGSMLAPTTGEGSGLPRFAADTPQWFAGPSSIVCPGHSARLNLTVYASRDLPLGQYVGTLRLLTRAGGRC